MAPIIPNSSTQSHLHLQLASTFTQFTLSPLWFLVALTFLIPASVQSRRIRQLSSILAISCFLLALTPFFLLSTSSSSITLPNLIRQGVDSVAPPSIPLEPPALPIPSPIPGTAPTTTTTTTNPTDTETVDTDSEPLPPVDSDPIVVQDSSQDDLSLDNCSGGLVRMQVVLFIELLCEIFFVLVRCLADAQFDDDSSSSSSSSTTSSSSSSSDTIDITYRGFVFVRGIYTIPVIIINAAIYWIGGGNTGACKLLIDVILEEIYCNSFSSTDMFFCFYFHFV